MFLSFSVLFGLSPVERRARTHANTRERARRETVEKIKANGNQSKAGKGREDRKGQRQTDKGIGKGIGKGKETMECQWEERDGERQRRGETGEQGNKARQGQDKGGKTQIEFKSEDSRMKTKSPRREQEKS
jgi:hypothetical protein